MDVPLLLNQPLPVRQGPFARPSRKWKLLLPGMYLFGIGYVRLLTMVVYSGAEDGGSTDKENVAEATPLVQFQSSIYLTNVLFHRLSPGATFRYVVITVTIIVDADLVKSDNEVEEVDGEAEGEDDEEGDGEEGENVSGDGNVDEGYVISPVVNNPAINALPLGLLRNRTIVPARKVLCLFAKSSK